MCFNRIKAMRLGFTWVIFSSIVIASGNSENLQDPILLLGLILFACGHIFDNKKD